MTANRFNFRAWEPLTKPPRMLYLIDDDTLDFVFHSPLIPMQSTGLTDKNGVEIFEGDIVRYDYTPGEGCWNCQCNGTISFKGTGFHFDSSGLVKDEFWKGGGFSGWLCSLPGAYDAFTLATVIGNIYENPELLEQA